MEPALQFILYGVFHRWDTVSGDGVIGTVGKGTLQERGFVPTAICYADGQISGPSA
jgi:hypothetical protein